MRSLRVVVALVVVLRLGAVSARAESASPAARVPVTGSVVDTLSAALPGITLRAGQASAISDEHGAFTLEMPPGERWLVAEGAGYCTIKAPVTPGVSRSPVIALQRCAEVSGTVTSSGKPVAEARVSVDVGRQRPAALRAGAEDEGGLVRGVAEAVTKSDGTFRLGPLPRLDGYALEVRHPDFAPFASRVDLLTSTAARQIALPAPAEVRGVFRGADDKPVGGVEVFAIDLDRPARADDVPRAVSGADGTFRLRPLAAGRVRLEVHPAEGITQYRGPLVLTAGDVRDLGTIIVRPGVLVRGRVVGPDGAPVAKARIAALRDLGETRKVERRAVSDAKGQFEIKGLTPARYVLRVEPPAPYLSVTTDELTAPAKDVAVTVRRSGTITGFVSARGGSCTLDRLRVEAFEQRRSYARPAGKAQVTDALRGAFEVTELPDAEIVVSAAASGCLPGRTKPARVPEGQEVGPVEIVLQSGATIEGRVVDASNGDGVAGARLRLDDAVEDEEALSGKWSFVLIQP